MSGVHRYAFGRKSFYEIYTFVFKPVFIIAPVPESVLAVPGKPDVDRIIPDKRVVIEVGISDVFKGYIARFTFIGNLSDFFETFFTAKKRRHNLRVIPVRRNDAV